jgi:hypothetical protein
MIQAVDESLRALVKREALNGSKADVTFEAPTRDWAARRNTPTVDLYLYDIREDVERRQVAFEEVRDAAGAVTERRRPPRRFKLSYLVTAWTQRPEDEHRLLSSLLNCFVGHQVVPADLTTWSRYPIYLNIALPPPQDRSISDVWSALGGELKPSLDLVVNAPVEEQLVAPAGPPVLEEPRFTVSRPGAGVERVKAKPASRARKSAEPGPASRAHAEGQPAPEQGSAPTSEPAPEPPRLRAIQEETIRSGREQQPGRVVRMRGLPRRP